ncbi:MAG: enoyl-CoA hydratase-related protein, partial [Halobacteriaceae archaeon]
HDELGAAYEPCPAFERQVEAGDLGRKTGAGFYDYDDGGPELSPEAADPDLAELLVAVMANEVAKLVAGGVADAEAIDRAMRLGAGFPEGPASMADQRGVAALHERLVERYEETGAPRYAPADELAEMADAGRGFRENGSDFDSIDVSTEGAVGRIVLDGPQLNAITPGALDELGRAVERFENDDGVRAILVTGGGERAFSAGADLGSVAGSTAIDGVELARRGQRAFGRFESSSLPVVAGIDGYCLGGGMELAACADLRVAGTGSVFGQVEHDLGLMPGWGGTQRLRHIVGEGRAREIILTADRYDAETMADYGFVNEVADDPESRALELAAELAAGPPIAQRYTKRAFLAGRGDTDAGLEVEAAAFGQLLETDDFSEGMAAFDADRDPEFEGR